MIKFVMDAKYRENVQNTVCLKDVFVFDEI